MTELAEYFRAQADWRAGKAEQYPDDERNALSAAALDGLADFVTPDEDGNYKCREIERLFPYLHPDGFALGGQRVAREVSRYGFATSRPKIGLIVGPKEQANHLAMVEALLPLCMADAYDDAVDIDNGDWTDTLAPCELEAARQGVYLPERYWQRRAAGLHTEDELPEMVAAYAGAAS